MSGGGLVRRGGYLCECDNGRWVRVFGPARDYWRRALDYGNRYGAGIGIFPAV